MLKRIWAKVTTTFAGTHHWPGCPEDWPHPYLKHPHRHLFRVTVQVEQRHDDRDLEYLVLKDQVESFCRGGDMQHRSCEMMAGQLADMLLEKHGRCVRVEVMEDGENGALVEVTP